MKRLRECKVQGCHNLTSEIYCKEHKHLEVSRITTSNWAALYKTKWWVYNRKDFLLKHPFCEVCGKPSNTVHHDPEHNGDIIKFKDKTTWHALCTSCHSKIHMTRTNLRGRDSGI